MSHSDYVINLDDECYNDDWACGVGMKLEKLNKLELEFLSSLGWNLNVTQVMI